MVGVCLLSHRGSPALGPSGSSSATPNLTESLAEVVAMLVKCGAVRMTDTATAAVNGPPLLPTEGKVGAEIQPGVGVDATGGVESARLYWR